MRARQRPGRSSWKVHLRYDRGREADIFLRSKAIAVLEYLEVGVASFGNVDEGLRAVLVQSRRIVKLERLVRFRRRANL